MAKIHYHPYQDADCDKWMQGEDKYLCGTEVGESVEISSGWLGVTCKRCLKIKDKIENLENQA